MANIIVIEKNGTYKGAYVVAPHLSFDKLKEKKAINGRIVYKVTDLQMEKIHKRSGHNIKIENGKVVILTEQPFEEPEIESAQDKIIKLEKRIKELEKKEN